MIFEVAAEPAGCGTQHVQGLAFILGSFNRFLLYQCNDHPFSFNICIFLGPAGLSPNSKLEIFYRYIFPIIHSFPSNSKCPMSNRFTGISKALVLPKDVWRPSNRASVVGNGNWTASAKVCDGMPSRAFSRAPASSEAYQARCSAYQSASLPSHGRRGHGIGQNEMWHFSYCTSYLYVYMTDSNHTTNSLRCLEASSSAFDFISSKVSCTFAFKLPWLQMLCGIKWWTANYMEFEARWCSLMS